MNPTAPEELQSFAVGLARSSPIYEHQNSHTGTHAPNHSLISRASTLQLSWRSVRWYDEASLELWLQSIYISGKAYQRACSWSTLRLLLPTVLQSVDRRDLWDRIRQQQLCTCDKERKSTHVNCDVLQSWEQSTLLCHHTSIYTLLDRQAELQEGKQWTGMLLWFKPAAQRWLFEHASHRVSGRLNVTHYARLERENCSHPERALWLQRPLWRDDTGS